MACVDPDSVPRVAVESMNEVHLEEVEMLNALDDLLAASDGSEASHAKIDASFDALVQHTRAHFASEEKLMVDKGFPAYPIHRQEHEAELLVIQRAVEAWQESRDAAGLRTWIEKDFVAWIANHIITMDTVTAQFVASRH